MTQPTVTGAGTAIASPPHRRLGAGEKIGYALGDTATNFVWRAVIVFLPFYLTEAAGIGAAAVGVLLLVCRVWDGVSDLAMGAVADRTHTRWGKFRPWILWMAVPFGVMGVLTFTAPDLGPTGRLVYAYITYSLLILFYTMSNVPYNSLMGVMSANPAERGNISSYRFFFAFLGGLFLQGFTPSLVAAVEGKVLNGNSYRANDWIWAKIGRIYGTLNFVNRSRPVYVANNRPEWATRPSHFVLNGDHGPFLMMRWDEASRRNAWGVQYGWWHGDERCNLAFLDGSARNVASAPGDATTREWSFWMDEAAHRPRSFVWTENSLGTPPERMPQ